LLILLDSVNNGADSVAVAAYVVVISSPGCRTFLHVTLLSMRCGVATWVPFFDNGKCLTQGTIHVGFVPQINRFHSGCYHFSSAHFGV
jgi:hypothetical protein